MSGHVGDPAQGLCRVGREFRFALTGRLQRGDSLSRNDSGRLGPATAGAGTDRRSDDPWVVTVDSAEGCSVRESRTAYGSGSQDSAKIRSSSPFAAEQAARM